MPFNAPTARILALRFYPLVANDGDMPHGDRDRVSIAVASIPALLATMGYANENRWKRKYAFDISYSVRNFPHGIDALVEATKPPMEVDSALQGYRVISGTFRMSKNSGRQA